MNKNIEQVLIDDYKELSANSINYVEKGLTDEFMELSAQAIEYKDHMSNAKSSLKKEYFKKKLDKTNKKVYSLLAKMKWMNMMKQAREAEQAEPTVEVTPKFEGSNND